MRLARAIGGLALAAVLLATATAHADIFAAVDVQGPTGNNSDVAVMNASTGARLTLPAGVDTPVFEFHPSISTSGKLLTFERADFLGSVRIIVTDLLSRQSADLFNGFETSQHEPSNPALSPDGSMVFTGGEFDQDQGSFFSDVTTTGLTPFPHGPFSHGLIRPGYSFAGPGAVSHPTAGGNLLVYGERRSGGVGELILTQLGGTPMTPFTRAGESFGHPALAASNPQQLLFLRQRPGDDEIEFLPVSPAGLNGTPTRLPLLVNHGEVARPALTPDGRYVGFTRPTDGHDRLFVWDSQTQTLLNPAGIDLGEVGNPEIGNLSLYTTRSLLALATVAPSGLVTAIIRAPTGVGLLVQRIVGRHRVLGRGAFKVRTVGRVPLGNFKRGHLRTHWNLRVNGKRLHPGRYLVTVRGVTRKRVVRELGKPRVIRIHSR